MWVTQGLMESLLSDPELRKDYIFYIVPLANPDGRIAGLSRSDTDGVDLNREWGDESDMEPEVSSIYNFMKSKRCSLDLVIDAHTQPFNPYAIIYSESDSTREILASKIAKHTEYDDYEDGYGGTSTITGRASSFGILSIILEHSQCKESYNLNTFLDDGAGLLKAIDEYFDTTSPSPPPPTDVTVLLDDGFESSDWDTHWDASPSDWYRNTYEHEGSQCAAARYGYDGAFTCDPLDAGDALALHVEFWYMKYGTESSDYMLYYWDGSSYVLVDALDDNGEDYPAWIRFSDDVTDTRFFVDDFRVRLVANMGSGEDVWLDDVKITKMIVAPS